MRQKFNRYLNVSALIMLAFVPSLLFAQGAGRINGYLHDKVSGSPLPYARIILGDTQFTAVSDVHGYYVLSGIPPGSYKLIVSKARYERVEKEVDIQPDGELRLDIEVAPEAVELEEVTVTGELTRFKEDVEISRTHISSEDIVNTPSFVEADVFRTIQQLPSVTSQSDFSSALIVRGGRPDENLILVDGAEIYNPYHLGGLFSTFNADTIVDAKFLAGGYPAEYPGRLSSILDITSREGKQIKGKGEVSLLSSKMMLEGPFYKGAWIISGRRTYFDLIAERFNRARGEDQDWRYYFWDGQIKIFSDLNAENRLTFSTFDGRDVLTFFYTGEDEYSDDTTDFNWNWGNNAPSLKWRYVPNAKFFSELVLTRSNFDFDVDLEVTEVDIDASEDATVAMANNQIQDYSISERLTWYLSPQHTLKMGATAKKLNMEFNLHVDNVNYFDVAQDAYIFNAFIQDKWKLNDLLSLQFGLRGTKYELHDNIYLDPRFGFKYLLSDNLTFKGSWGRFNQFLFTVNDEDQILQIVDFWLPVPEEFDAITNQHFILGFERWFNPGFTGSVEAYYKPYSNVLTSNLGNDPGRAFDEFISGTGRVWGLEFFLKKTAGKFTGWLGYSYSNVERRFDFNEDGKIEKTENRASEIYPPKYSRPHSLNFVTSYQMSRNNRFSLSWTVSSGQPYTPVVGKVYYGGDSPDNPYRDVVSIEGRKNSSRYPPYVRGDIAWIRDISPFGANGKFKLQVINFTNHYNYLLYIWDHDRSPSKVTAISMFPIIPTFGIEFEF